MNKHCNIEIVSCDKSVAENNSDFNDNSHLEKVDFTKSAIVNDDKVLTDNNTKNGNNLIIDNITPIKSKKRKESDRDNDDNNSEYNLMNSPLFEISDSDDETPYSNGSEKRKKIIREQEIKKIALCAHSWTCLKCNLLNSQKARSCDDCGIKKPSVQVPLKRKVQEDVFILGVRQKQKPGRKPKIKAVVTEDSNINNTLTDKSIRMKDEDINIGVRMRKSKEDGKIFDDIKNDVRGKEDGKSDVDVKAEMIALAEVVAVIQIDDQLQLQLQADSGS